MPADEAPPTTPSAPFGNDLESFIPEPPPPLRILSSLISQNGLDLAASFLPPDGLSLLVGAAGGVEAAALPGVGGGGGRTVPFGGGVSV